MQKLKKEKAKFLMLGNELILLSITGLDTVLQHASKNLGEAKNKQKIAAKNYFGNDGFQNTLIYQPTLILKDINDNYHVSACK